MANCDLFQRAFAKAVPGLQGKGQDAASVLTRNGVTALAVADGVTSAGQYAGLGAQSAVTAATVFLTEKFDKIVDAGEDRLRNYFFSYFRTYYLQELNVATENAGLPPVLEDTKAILMHFRLYSTTIIACAVRDDQLVMMKIGNGSVVADAGAGFGVVSPSELVRGQTPCIERLYDPGFEYFSFRRYCVPCLTCLVLMSDGVEHTFPLLYDELNQRLTQDFPGWIQTATRTEESFSAAVEQLGRTGEDDVAVAVLVRGEADISPKTLLNENPFADCELYRRSAAPDRFGNVDQEHALPTATLTPPQNPADSLIQPNIDVSDSGSELQEPIRSTTAPVTPSKPADSARCSSVNVPGPGQEFQEPLQPTATSVTPSKLTDSALCLSIDMPSPGIELKQAQSVSSNRLNTTLRESFYDEHFWGLKYKKINTDILDPFRQNAGNAEKGKDGKATLTGDAEPSDEGIGHLEEVSPAADTQDQDSGLSESSDSSSRRFPWDSKLLLIVLLLATLATVIIALKRLLRL